MAPFDNPYSSNITNKLSPIIEGQVPDFIQADHAAFVKFLKYYYQYLEAGELRVTVSIDNLLLELETTSYALDVDGDKIVLENGTDVTTGKFVVGETITGGTSKATATVLVDDLGHSTKPRMFISGQQQFQTGETITGGTSGATGTVVRYRANPVQNIQQLLEYANVDNTIYDFLDQLRESFMNAIPSELATGINKRNLIKNIRELYRAKGTSEGHKIFMRMLLDENIDIVYPNKYMMRSSDGKWTNQTILRCSPGVNAAADEMLGVTITGQSSGATAVIANAISTAEGGDPIVIFEINPASLVGTFTDGETIQGTSTVQDVTMSFTVRGMVTGYTVTGGGKLYAVGDDLDLDTSTKIGNGEALAEVASIKTGSVSRVIIDDAGLKYRVGDTLTFTTTEGTTTSDPITNAATGFVSVVGGSIEMDGTDSSSSDAGDNLILEAETTSSLVNFDIVLDGHGQEATALTNGAVSSSTSLVLDGNSGTIVVGMTLSGKGISRNQGITVSTVTDQNNIVISSAVTLADNVNLRFDNIEDGAGDKLVLDRTDSGGANAGENIITHLTQESLDTYGTENDTFALEEGTVTTGEITRIYLKDGGEGYSLLPTVTVTSTNGTGAALLADTNDIGAVDSVNITNQGFKYTEAPEGRFRANFLLKDVTGTFTATNTLSSSGHTGVVKDWNSTTKVLKTTFEDVQRVTMETSDGEGIGLEDSLVVLTDRAGETDLKLDSIIEGQGNTLLEDATAGVGRKLLLDGTAEVGIDRIILDGTDSSSSNAGERILAEGYQRPGFELGFISEEMGNPNSSTPSRRHPGSWLPWDISHEIRLERQNSWEEFSIRAEDGSPMVLETSPSRRYRRPIELLTGQRRFSVHRGRRPRAGITPFFNDLKPTRIINSRNLNQFEVVENEGESLLIDNSEVISSTDMRILLDGTDASGTDAGDNIISESTGNSIILNGTDGTSAHAGDRLLSNVEALSGSIAIDGTNSSSAHAGDNIVNEEVTDFSTETVTITDSGGATGTVVSVDIAKGTTSIGTKTETIPSYGVSIESLIGEDLNRIQDSIYYQQFAYEINAASSSADYATELKKAVHPAGFNLFGKVSIATQVSMTLPTVGSSLGGGYTADTDTYSPILASTFKLLFSEKVQRRTGVVKYDVSSFEDEILLEDDNFTEEGSALSMDNEVGGDDTIILEEYHNPVRFTDRILLNTEYAGEHNAPPGEIILEDSRIENIVTLETGYNLLRETEIYSNNLVDENDNDFVTEQANSSTGQLDYFVIEAGTDSGDTKLYFLLEENLQAHLTTPYADGRLVAESGVEITYDLLLEDEELQSGGRLMPGFSGTASYFLIDGLDSSLTGAGDRIVIENAPTAKLLAEPLNDHNVLLNEDGGSQHLETSGKGNKADKEITLVSMITTKVMLPRKQTSSLPSGLITMAQHPFGSAAGTLSLEMGITGGGGSGNLLVTGWNQINTVGNVDRVTADGEDIALEDASDDNIGTGFSFEDFGSYSQDIIVLDGTDGSSSNAGDNILINNIGDPPSVTVNQPGVLLGEHSLNYSYMTLEDIIGRQIFMGNIDSGDEVNIILEHIGGSGSESTASTAGQPDYGSILLEDSLLVNSKGNILNETAGVGNTISLESNPDFLIPEDEVKSNPNHGYANSISIPEENYTSTTAQIEPYTYSSDVVTRPIDALVLEEQGKESTNIQLETGTTNGEFANLLNDATSTDADGVAIDGGSTIALEDYFDITGAYHGGAKFLLDRTAASGDFTNVGEQVLLETATYYETLIQTAAVSLPQTFENAFDSTLKTFDRSTIRWDSTL
mgnify:CR=1 FL=1